MKLIDLVNIKQGTASERRFSNGNTLPLTALPHALAAFAPQTSSSRESWFYHPADRSCEGIRLTHQPSPWIGDFSYFTFMPQSEGVFVSPDARWSGFRPSNAELHPHYLSLKLLRYGATVSLAPTDTGAAIKLDFDETVTVSRFAVTPANFDGEINVDEEAGEIYGYTTSKNGRPEREFRCYFLFKFNCKISDSYVTDGNSATVGKTICGNAAGANVRLDGKHVECALAVSYIGYEQARLNLKRDSSCGYETAKAKAAELWEGLLNRIEVAGQAERRKTFYSCLYRAFLYPTKFYEIDKDGNSVHVVPETGELKKGVMYTNNGFWDTFRTVYPLYSLIAPEKCAEIAEGWLNFFDDTGYLPRWTSPCEAGCMPGTLIEAVLADAAVKNLLTEINLRRALAAVLTNAEKQSANDRQGRKCVEEYSSLGYVPYDKCWESVNETLDCAYGDFCIAQIAACLGEKAIADKYYKRSKNYANLFDSESGFMRAKDSNGNFRPDFDRYAWGKDYTEGSSYQTTIAVQHDLEGLALLYGGKDKFISFIDDAVNGEPIYHIGGYGGEIHEMTEMAAADFGQCAISNQPSFHMPYIYAELGEKQKSAELVERLAGLFTSSDDGFPGDEDNGTTAAWYIFSTLGFYPVCPGRASYVVTKPLFDSAVMHCGEDNKIEINIIKLLEGRNTVAQNDFCKIIK